MKNARIFAFAALLSLCGTARAAVVPEYATNTYKNHELSRAEQKCIDEGYKITYANCSNQTAPAERCPHHDSYYRSCSQEQWCRNNNFTFLEKDCKIPLYPHKMCDNKFPLYRVCIENIGKACEDKGFVHKDKCQLNDKKCPYSPEYGKCCDNCPKFTHSVNAVPEGYVAFGETCTTCSGEVKTNIRPAECEGFQNCRYGPMSSQTPSCLQGKKTLYSLCKTDAMVCQEKGFIVNSCADTEDAFDCPENPSFKRCKINCLKLARVDNPEADVFGADQENPILDVTKNELISVVGMIDKDCRNLGRPTLTFRINKSNLEQYAGLFDRYIADVNINLIFEEPVTLSANGKYRNVKITAQGEFAGCPLSGHKTEILGTVSFNNFPNICTNFTVFPNAKLLTTGSIKGNVDVGKDAALGIKGDLNGALKAQSFAEIFIKGQLNYTDELNNNLDNESIVFGCNSKIKIGGGINAKTSNVVIKQWSKLDTPYIKITSTSDNTSLPNTLSSIHLYKYAKLFSTYEQTVFPLVENDDAQCDDKYYRHLGSATDAALQEFSLEPSNRGEDKWQCRSLTFKQQECN